VGSNPTPSAKSYDTAHRCRTVNVPRSARDPAISLCDHALRRFGVLYPTRALPWVVHSAGKPVGCTNIVSEPPRSEVAEGYASAKRFRLGGVVIPGRELVGPPGPEQDRTRQNRIAGTVSAWIHTGLMKILWSLLLDSAERFACLLSRW